jgi:cytochrome c553
MPLHIVRLIFLVVVIGAAAYIAKTVFTADSFYLYGHYRGNSVAEIASEKPRYKGPEYCQSCHAERYAEWFKGVHNTPDIGKVVKCEVCHGAAGSRDVRGRFEHSASGPDHPNNVKLIIPTDTTKLCSLCHEKMPGRPAEQRQIDVASHAGTQQCKTCHNPHSPKIVLAAARPKAQPANAAAGKAKSSSCAACHGADGVSSNPAWPSLAGQKEAYLAGALKAYKVGGRDSAVMAGIVKALGDADMASLAAYYAGLSCQGAPGAVNKQAAAAGQAKASNCAACHGAGGVSPNPAWPSLAGQPKGYLVSALKAYKSGTRNNAMMAAVAKDLSDADIENLAAYYASASCK